MELWLNPACSKCRLAVEELDKAGVDEATLRDVVGRLGLEPWTARTGA